MEATELSSVFELISAQITKISHELEKLSLRDPKRHKLQHRFRRLTKSLEDLKGAMISDDSVAADDVKDDAIRGEWSSRTSDNCAWALYQGDALKVLRHLGSETVDCVITSPPYFWLRNYGVEGQIGLEQSVDSCVGAIADVMSEIYRVLRSDGVVFLNLGDTYYSGKGVSHGNDAKSRKRRFGLRVVDMSGGLGLGLKPKTIIGIPWRVAIELTHRNWILRSPIIWHRKKSLPEAVKDRPRRNYEYIFMLVKNRKYYFKRDALIAALEEDMWTIPPRPEMKNEIDTAPFPDELVQRCLSIGCKPQGTVLDPFAGSGTTMRVSLQSGRNAIGIELNAVFCNYITSQLSEL